MERFREKGIRLTPQRLAVLEYLEGNTGHPTAEDVLTAVKRIHPNISPATVYNTLKTLRDRGELIELTFDPDRKHFDPNTEPHHHLLCEGCGDVADICVDFEVSLPQELESKYEILGHRIEFYGLCPKCLSSDTKRKGGN